VQGVDSVADEEVPMPAETRDARFWNKTARKYAHDPIADMAGYERTLERTAALLGAEDTVLEIGCGTATTALRLRPGVRRLVATDISSEMIAIAREKVAAAGVTGLEPIVATLDTVPEIEGGYDAVLAFNVLHLLPDRQVALARVLRLLRPGGLFISKTACLSEMNPLIRLAVPVMRLVGKAPHVGFFKGAALEAEVVGAGFTLVERARHGSGRKDPRLFLVARKPASATGAAGVGDREPTARS
jgi:ubiquinone/menaquinone biosynthesis C-methylase UbiE